MERFDCAIRQNPAAFRADFIAFDDGAVTATARGSFTGDVGAWAG